MSAAVGCASSTGSGGEGGSPGSGGNNNSSGNGGSNTGSGGNNNTGGSNSTGSGGQQNQSGGSTGSGGSGARGGSTGSGGVVGTGGRASGGSTGAGGSNPTGGSTGSGGSNPTGNGGSSGSCSVSSVMATQSTKIPTVFSVTFSQSLSKPTSGHIDFGLDTSYGLQAPIDFTQTNSKTLLLGMKASKTYHYKVTVSDGANTCSSTDQTVMTGALPNGSLPQLTITTNNKAGLYGGYLVTGSYQGAKVQSFILDGDGDYVWWYSTGTDGCGTRMSYDGKYMWINSANVPDQGGKVHRVTMDGMEDTDFSTPFKGESHQLTPLPDGSVAFYATGSNGCDDVKIFPANGTPSSSAMTVVNAKTAHGGSGACHLNNIEYDASDDTLVFSDLDNVCLTKVTKTGSTVWVWGGTNGVTSTITGDAWVGGEHGFHIISATDWLIFNNNSPNAATALELTLDATAKKATKKWSYVSNPNIKVQVLGDVQRMTDNGPTGAGKGNTIVDYGTGDQIHEVDANGMLLQQIKSPSPFGFMEKRFSLYGKPTR
ncbi:MAG TPA: arylsulfotransferase family protein [Polyangia bacterium]|nr:arylsulfotransferase family protein [Polyangia bacterium]